MNNEQTFVIIKPDAIERGLVGKTISRFEDVGLYIEKIEKRLKDTPWCRAHYAHIYNATLPDFDHTAKLIYTYLEQFMTGHSTIGIILVGSDAIKRVKRMTGATNALEAEPGTIRGDWGQYSGPYNLIHASDSIEAVEREIALYFDKETDQ